MARPFVEELIDKIVQRLRSDPDLCADIVRLGMENLDPSLDKPVFERRSRLAHDGSPFITSKEADYYVGSRSSLNRMIKRGILPAQFQSGRNKLYLRDRCERVRDMILAGRISPGVTEQDDDIEIVAELDGGDIKFMKENGL